MKLAGCLDDGFDEICTINVEPLRGPVVDGSPYMLRLMSRELEAAGCQAYDSESCCGCSFPEMTIYFEPDSVLIGTLDFDHQNIVIAGRAWRSHEPMDFTSIRVAFRNGPPCTTTKTFDFPLVWLEVPVKAQRLTFGRLRSLYR